MRRSNCFRDNEDRRLKAEQAAAVGNVVDGGSEAAVIVIFESDETEGLQDAGCHLAHRGKQFGHAVYRAGLGLKREFHERATSERLRQLQQSTRYGDALQFCFGAASVFQADRSQD